MEVIAGAASVSQLVSYSFSSVRCLQRLYTELNNGHSTYHNEETNISLLLDIVKQLPSQNIKDSDPILPILVDISGLACEILHLLRPRQLWGFNWTPFAVPNKLISAFEALDKKQRLLHLYITQASNGTLAAIRKAVDGQSANKSLFPPYIMASPPSPTPAKNSFIVMKNFVSRSQSILQGQENLPNYVNVSDNSIGGDQSLGNTCQGSAIGTSEGAHQQPVAVAPQENAPVAPMRIGKPAPVRDSKKEQR